eukprot:CAMPEP_0197026452 /NCGR_PEP_ID=MMETSP1384-20130603/6535_1 /TAXON_ID=29189 /ORGANISM="Ammonia sp." /LENGTH=188 /DNA_ID=CAMNT_0042455117 /DNA_START=21 /DNA_END=584 /DNA_ORIENTATION=-
MAESAAKQTQKKEGMDFRFLIAPTSWIVTIAVAFFLFPTDALTVAHLFSTAMNFGMTAYVTCIAGTIMFTTLSRPQFTKVQSKLFPIYFAMQSVCSFLTALSMLKSSSDSVQAGIACLSFGFCFIQSIYLEPKTHAALQVWNKIRKEEGEESQTKQFKAAKGKFFAFHGISTLCNIGSFLLQTVHIYW